MPAKAPEDESSIVSIDEAMEQARVASVVDLQEFVSKLYNDDPDVIFSDYSEGAFDGDLFLVNNFDFSTEENSAADTDSALVSRVGNGVAIYEDKIQDLYVNGAESSDGAFSIYSPICTRNPEVINAEKIMTGDGTEAISFDIDHPEGNLSGFTDTYRYYYNYYSLEQTELHTKYACIPGINSIAEAPMKALEYIDNIANETCLEIYSTVATKEYVPQRIKQNPVMQQIFTETTLGEETQVADGTAIVSSARVY